MEKFGKLTFGLMVAWVVLVGGYGLILTIKNGFLF